MMNKPVKRLLSTMLVIGMIAGSAGVRSFAEEESNLSSNIQIIEDGGINYYLADGGEAGPENFDVWTSKTITGTENEDEFEVTLQVGTTMKAIPSDVAVMLVMDVSGSMMNDETGTRLYDTDVLEEGRKRRIEYTREAALEFAENYVKNANGAERMLSIVQFGNTANTVLPWTNVNFDGQVAPEAVESLENLRVNFTLEANKSYWNEEKALTDLGKIDYWDGTEAAAELKDYFVPYEEESTESAAEELDETEVAKYCSYEGCTEHTVHGHCDICGSTTEHVHVKGCTLANCPTPLDGPHKHGCTWSCDALIPYFIKYNRWSHTYNYRCLNPDPAHTHERVDSDIAYLTGSRYFGSVWAIGTNMEAGLLLARNLVNAGLEEGGAIEDINNVYVILLSDGKPTWMTDETSGTELNKVLHGDNWGEWEAIKDVVVTGEEGDIAIAEDIKKVSKLYAILYGSEMEKTFSENHALKGISCSEWITSTADYCIGADEVFNSPAADGIDTAFLQINDRIDMLAKAWVVGNELTDDVSFEGFTLNSEYAAYFEKTADKNASISWNLGGMEPESGTGSMEDPYIYTLKYKIHLKSAKDSVKAASLAHDENPSLDGLFDSVHTNLRYFMVDKDELAQLTPEQIEEKMRDAAFENVSVKGIYGDYSFIKKNMLTGETMEGVGFTLYDATGKAYGTEVFSDASGNVAFQDIPRGDYKLKESTPPTGMMKMDDLGLEESWGEVKGYNGNVLPEVVWNTPVSGILIIEKSLDSYNKSLGDTTFVFQVDATVTDATTNAKEIVYSDVVSMVFDKPGTQSIVVKDLPSGADVTVTEVYTGASYKLTTDTTKTAVIAGEDAEKPATVTFGNTYDGRMNSGNGILNNFSFDSTVGSWVHKVLEALSF